MPKAPTNPVLPVSPFQGASPQGAASFNRDVVVPTPSQPKAPTNPVLPVSPFQGAPAQGAASLGQSSSYQSLVQSAIAKAKGQKAAPAAPAQPAQSDEVKAS